MIEVFLEHWTRLDGATEYHWSVWRDGYRIEMGGKAFTDADDCETEALDFCVKALGK